MLERDVGLIVAAAGAGVRLGKKGNKIFIQVGGRALLEYTLLTFEQIPRVAEVVFAVPKELVGEVEMFLTSRGLPRPWKVVPGGETRHASVKKALGALSSQLPWILIHDVARPFATPFLVEGVLGGLAHHPAVVPVIPVSDTIKYMEDGKICRTVDRSHLYRAQTPQGFHRDILIQAFQEAHRSGLAVTDEAMLVEELLGIPVVPTFGDEWNLKITIEKDFELAEWLVGHYWEKEMARQKSEMAKRGEMVHGR